MKRFPRDHYPDVNIACNDGVVVQTHRVLLTFTFDYFKTYYNTQFKTTDVVSLDFPSHIITLITDALFYLSYSKFNKKYNGTIRCKDLIQIINCAEFLLITSSDTIYEPFIGCLSDKIHKKLADVIPKYPRIMKIFNGLPPSGIVNYLKTLGDSERINWLQYIKNGRRYDCYYIYRKHPELLENCSFKATFARIAIMSYTFSDITETYSAAIHHFINPHNVRPCQDFVDITGSLSARLKIIKNTLIEDELQYANNIYLIINSLQDIDFGGSDYIVTDSDSEGEEEEDD